jgi:multiple sugar transport system substrate-binding protein
MITQGGILTSISTRHTAPVVVRRLLPAARLLLLAARFLLLAAPLLLLAAPLLLLVACGPASPTPAGSPGPTPSVTVPFEMPAVIAIYGSFDDQTLAVLDRQIATFEADNPDMFVEVVEAVRDDDERRAEMAAALARGDSSLDLYVVPTTWVAELAAGGGLAPLATRLAAHGIYPGDFFPASAGAATYAGDLVAIPWTADGGFLYYRRDLLDEGGVSPPATWPELAGAVDRVAGPAGLDAGFVWQGAAYEGLTCATLEFVWSEGGAVLGPEGAAAWDTPETVAGLAQMEAFIAAGVSPPEVATWREAAALEAFGAGNALFMRNWAYAWDRLNEPGSPVAGRVGVAPLPASCLGGQVIALSQVSLHPEEAARFLAFLAAHEQQAQLALEGVQPPARTSVYTDEDVLVQRPVLADFFRGLQVTRPRPASPRYPALSAAIYTRVNDMLRGEADPAATAAAIHAEIEAIVEKSP